MEPSTVRVLVVDDYDPWRSFTISTLQKQPGFEIVGEVSDGLEAVLLAAKLQPDLILLDIGLPTLNGIEAARRMHERSPKSRILFVSENRFPDIAAELKAKGVEFTREPTTVRPGVRVCFIRAPEGVSIELLDRDAKYKAA